MPRPMRPDHAFVDANLGAGDALHENSHVMGVGSGSDSSRKLTAACSERTALALAAQRCSLHRHRDPTLTVKCPSHAARTIE